MGHFVALCLRGVNASAGTRLGSDRGGCAQGQRHPCGDRDPRRDTEEYGSDLPHEWLRRIHKPFVAGSNPAAATISPSGRQILGVVGVRKRVTPGASIHRGIHCASNRPRVHEFSDAGRGHNDHPLWPLMALVSTSDLSPQPYPHADDGVEVRRIFHQLSSLAMENVNKHFKAIFGLHGSVPTKGLRNAGRFTLGAIFVYKPAVLYRFEHGLDLNVGLKPFLRAA
jgi:hypothetical protein